MRGASGPAGDPGAGCTRQHILDIVWQPNHFGPTETLDVHIAALRRRLGDSAWIDTIRGVGFRLRPPAGAPAAVPGGRRPDRTLGDPPSPAHGDDGDDDDDGPVREGVGPNK